MAHHKRKRPAGSATCGMCKPHKKPGCRKRKSAQTPDELASREDARDQIQNRCEGCGKHHEGKNLWSYQGKQICDACFDAALEQRYK